MEIPPLWRAPSSGISRGRCGPYPPHLPSLPAWTAGFAGAIPAAAYRTRCRISSPTGRSAITWSSHRLFGFPRSAGRFSVSPAGSRRCLPPDTSVRSRLEENGKRGHPSDRRRTGHRGCPHPNRSHHPETPACRASLHNGLFIKHQPPSRRAG